MILLFYSIFADYYQLNVSRQRIILSGLYTHSNYPSIQFALNQVNSYLLLSQKNLQFSLNETEGIIHVNCLLFNFYFFSSSNIHLV